MSEFQVNATAIAYLVSAILFIMALRGLSSPESSRQGNMFGILGMIIAVAATVLSPGIVSYQWIIGAIIVGGGIGFMISQRISMTAMPQLVAAFHSLVGLAAVLFAIGTYLTHKEAGALDAVLMTELALGSF
ncbi:MAG: NAD(P)(+) transhydrogenase (Re/Si-specific) subunit beta, partial [Proteobacteria bacterium]|nr:NAD(P)(+) transhydrogenase (Re/Si-specific) subunit beta [Pseudomonadota bacterium]